MKLAAIRAAIQAGGTVYYSPQGWMCKVPGNPDARKISARHIGDLRDIIERKPGETGAVYVARSSSV